MSDHLNVTCPRCGLKSVHVTLHYEAATYDDPGCLEIVAADPCEECRAENALPWTDAEQAAIDAAASETFDPHDTLYPDNEP